MKEYKIFLDDVLIGTTNFEFADVPMGVVYGKVNFINVENPYQFVKNFYLKKNADFECDDEVEFIDSMIQDFIKIYYDENKLLIGWGSFLSGLKDEFEITFSGIDSELMKSEFSHHYYDYYGETD
jgi:hypothetical protein